MNAGTSSLLWTSAQPFSSFLRASVLPCTASTLLSVQPPTFGRFLIFLYWVLSHSYFHTSSPPISHTSLSTFFSINLRAFSYYLSLLLPDEASGRNIVDSTACSSTVCCSLNYVNTFRPRWMLELLFCAALRCCHSFLFCAILCCLVLLQLCLDFNRLRSSAFSSFCTGFCHFRIFHTSWSPISHTSLSPIFLH